MFVAEKMSDEVWKSLPFTVAKRVEDYRKWAIDRERDAYIVLINKFGGSYEGTQETKYYVLNWQGGLIRIVADPVGETFSEAGATMHWRIHKLEIPESLAHKTEEVSQLIKEAFRAVGEFFNGERFIAVDVHFDTSYAIYDRAKWIRYEGSFTVRHMVNHALSYWKIRKLKGTSVIIKYVWITCIL